MFLQTLQEQQAADRLAARIARTSIRQLEVTAEDLQKPSFASYRETTATQKRSNKNSIASSVTYNIEGNQRFPDVEEIDDSEMEKPDGAGVSYTVFD